MAIKPAHSGQPAVMPWDERSTAFGADRHGAFHSCWNREPDLVTEHVFFDRTRITVM